MTKNEQLRERARQLAEEMRALAIDIANEEVIGNVGVLAAASILERLEPRLERAERLLQRTLERMDVLNDPKKLRAHDAVTTELMLSTAAIRTFLTEE